MWEKVGIVRDGNGSQRGDARARRLGAGLPEPNDRASHELANLLLTGR